MIFISQHNSRTQHSSSSSRDIARPDQTEWCRRGTHLVEERSTAVKTCHRLVSALGTAPLHLVWEGRAACTSTLQYSSIEKKYHLQTCLQVRPCFTRRTISATTTAPSAAAAAAAAAVAAAEAPDSSNSSSSGPGLRRR